jgi:hypothetical protein
MTYVNILFWIPPNMPIRRAADMAILARVLGLG